MKSVLCLLPVLVLWQCAPVGPDYAGAPELPGGERFTGAAGETPAGALDQWWRRLGDRSLNRLVEGALKSNYDVAIAAERLREARALRSQVASAILPRGEGSLSHTRLDFGRGGGGLTGGVAGSGLIPDPLSYWTAAADVSWEVDLFGGRRREISAATARAQATQEDWHGVRLAVAADVVETYYTIAGLREQLSEVESQVALQEKQMKDTRDRLAAGDASELQLERMRSRLETTRAVVPPLQAGITGQLRRLALLSGAPPYSFDKGGVGKKGLPRRLPLVKAGLPAELVMRRPDLRRAERELAAATEDIGVAVANFYPRISLLASPGANTAGLGDLFEPRSFDFQVGPVMSWSLFSGGRNRAILEGADSRERQALYRYERAVLAAMGEVETQLAALKAEKERLAIVQRARTAASAAAKRVRETHEAGAVDQIDVLVEEEREREARIAEIRVKSQLVLVWTRLHKALGGGWR